jgi:hypothetical protein
MARPWLAMKRKLCGADRPARTTAEGVRRANVTKPARKSRAVKTFKNSIKNGL